MALLTNNSVPSSRRASLVAQRLKNLPTVRGTWVQSLGQEDPLEKGMATHSSILAWRIPWTRLSNFTFTFKFQELALP